MPRSAKKYLNSKQRLGKWGENEAKVYLLEKGYLLIDCNARTKYGEIDLIMQHEEVTVFVEVKTRSNTNYGFPEDSVTPRKQRHIVRSALAYLERHPHLEPHWRFDVVSILKLQGHPTEIMHFEDAF